MTARDADTAPCLIAIIRKSISLITDRTEDWTKIDLTDLQERIEPIQSKSMVPIRKMLQEMVIIQKKSKNIIRFVKTLKVISSNLANSEKILKVFLMLRQNQTDDRAAYFLQFISLIIQM